MAIKNRKNRKINIRTFDRLVEFFLVVLLSFMPLAFGARSAASEEVVVLLSGFVLFICLLRAALYPQAQVRWTAAYVPIIIFLVVIIFQIISLPAGIIKVISPNTFHLKTELLDGIPGSADWLRSMTLSFYPDGTAHDIRLVISVAAVFFVVFNYYSSAEKIKRLLSWIAVIGGFFVLVAILQKLFDNGRIYWFVQPSHPAFVGSFVNHSHYAQFANLSFGATFALLSVLIYERFAGRMVRPSEFLDRISSSSGRILWFFVVILGLTAASVFLSLSRGGIIGLLVACAVITLLLGRRRSLNIGGWAMVIIALTAFLCVLLIGFEAVCDRFAKASPFEGYRFRFATLRDLLSCFRLFPFLGTGLGTHAVIYPMFQSIHTTLIFLYVEDEYAQLMEEMGLVGLLTMVCFAAMIFKSFKNCITTPHRPVCSAAFGLGLGLTAILVHSLSDYGQHIPANAVLTAVFCAMLLRMDLDYCRQEHLVCSLLRPKFSQRVAIILLLLVSFSFAWALTGAHKAAQAQECFKKVQQIEKGVPEKRWQVETKVYNDLIYWTGRAVSYQNSNHYYNYWLGIYKWYALTKAVDADFDEDNISGQQLARSQEILKDFYHCCLVCPTYGPAYSMAGQIEKFVFDENRGEEKIIKGFHLAPRDPVVCMAAGRLDMFRGDIDSSVEKFDQAAKSEPRLFGDIADIYIVQLSRPDIAVELADSDIDRLSYVAQVLEEMQYNDLLRQVCRKTKNILVANNSKGRQKPEYYMKLAYLSRQLGEVSDTIDFYGRALDLNYANVYWRMDFAEFLAQNDRPDQAAEQARICLRIKPGFDKAERLLAGLLTTRKQ